MLDAVKCIYQLMPRIINAEIPAYATHGYWKSKIVSEWASERAARFECILLCNRCVLLGKKEIIKWYNLFIHRSYEHIIHLLCVWHNGAASGMWRQRMDDTTTRDRDTEMNGSTGNRQRKANKQLASICCTLVWMKLLKYPTNQKHILIGHSWMESA